MEATDISSALEVGPAWRQALIRHAGLLSNAGALATGTIVTAALGFVYWWAAARAFSPEAVGTAAAAVSMMTLLAQIGETGLGPLLVGQVPKRPAEAGPLISAALAAAACGCLAIALIYCGLAQILPLHIGALFDDASGCLLFVAGVGATGLSIVVDQALVGLMRSSVAMWRGIGFSLAKLALLLLMAIGLSGSMGGIGILATWIVSQAASLIVLAWLTQRTSAASWKRPRRALLQPLAGAILGHHAVNVALQTPALLMPLIVTVCLSAEVNAAFYAGWAILNVALLVPAALATVVYSTGSGDQARIATGLRLSLGISALTGLGAGFIFLLFSSFMLGLFNAAYPTLAGNSLAPLGFGAIAVGIKYHFVAIDRLRGRLGMAALVLAIGGVLEVGVAASAAAKWGLSGLVWGWLVAVFVQAALMIPLIARVARDQTDAASKAT